MGRKTIAFMHRGRLAVYIPEKSAERIQIGVGSQITAQLNSDNELRIRRVSDPISYKAQRHEMLIKANRNLKLLKSFRKAENAENDKKSDVPLR